jgi:hypothetical protein
MPGIRQHIDRHCDARHRIVEPCEPNVHGLDILVDAINDPDDPL